MNPIPKSFRAQKFDRPVLVANYTITGIRRFQCFPGKPVSGLYRDITDIAYQFTARKKSDPSPTTFTFHTGQPAGDELLTLTGKSLPPLQTWEVVPGSSGPGGGSAGVPGTTLAVHPFNAQLLQALNLFFMKYQCDPMQPSGQVFSKINANPTIPQYSGAAILNTVLIKHGETSTKLLADLAAAFGARPVRALTFDLLHAELSAKGIVPVLLP